MIWQSEFQAFRSFITQFNFSLDFLRIAFGGHPIQVSPDAVKKWSRKTRYEFASLLGGQFKELFDSQDRLSALLSIGKPKRPRLADRSQFHFIIIDFVFHVASRPVGADVTCVTIKEQGPCANMSVSGDSRSVVLLIVVEEDPSPRFFDRSVIENNCPPFWWIRFVAVQE